MGMHLDEVLEDIGVGTVQRFSIFCCSLLVLTEGFLSAGVFFMIPQVLCDQNLPWGQLIFFYLPFLFGIALGSVLLGGISDVKGRRHTFSISCAMCFVSCFVASASSLVLIFELFMVVLGMGLAGVHGGSRILVFEILPMTVRGKYMTVLELIYSMGTIGAIVWAHFLNFEERSIISFSSLRAWRLLFFVAGMISLLGSCVIGLTPFSPRQMLAHGRIANTSILLRRFYAINKKEHEVSYPNYQINRFSHVESRIYRRHQWSDYTVFLLRCMWSYILSTFGVAYFWSTCVIIVIHFLLFDGTILLNNIVSERIRMGPNCVLPMGRAVSAEVSTALCQGTDGHSLIINIYLALTSLLSIFSLHFLIDWCPRNAILSISCFLSTGLSIGLTRPIDHNWDIVFGILILFFHTSALVTLNVITLETYPTKFRNTAYGINKLFSTISLALVSIIPNPTCKDTFDNLYYVLLGASVFSLMLRNKNKKPIKE